MGGITPAATFWQSFYAYMTGTQYPLQIDSNSAVMQRVGASFAPSPMPDSGAMQICVDPGHLSNGTNLIEVGAWSTGTITSGSNQLVLTQNVSGVLTGMLIVSASTVPGGSGVIGSASGIPDITVVSSITGNTITMSSNATLSGTVYVKICYATSVISAPAAGYTRTDRVCINALTGILEYVEGTPVNTGTATPPAIPFGYIPCCQIFLTSSTTVISSGNIMDERDFCNLGTGFTAYGQCQFQYTSSTACTLVPSGGNKVSFPNGAIATIPSGGISTNPTSCYLNGTASSLTAATLYYAYLANIGGSWVIDWSATAYAVDSNSGITVKSGDSTRVLVGMAYIGAGPTFTVSASTSYVRSWFNDPGIAVQAVVSGSPTSTSTTGVEVSTSLRGSFLKWARDKVVCIANGAVFKNTASGSFTSYLNFDGTTQGNGTSGQSYTANALIPLVCTDIYTGNTLSEGPHYATLFGQNNAAGTTTWTSECLLQVTAHP